MKAQVLVGLSAASHQILISVRLKSTKIPLVMLTLYQSIGSGHVLLIIVEGHQQIYWHVQMFRCGH